MENTRYAVVIIAFFLLAAASAICAVYMNPLCWIAAILFAFSCIGVICSWGSRRN